MRFLPCPLLLLAALPAAAQAPAATVPVCESLVALRQLAASAGEDRTRAAALVAGRPGCRLVPREGIGAVEHRAMVGGAPYECLAQPSGGCVWVMP
ncbi:hypothetical protein [Methylobacterium radiodurans]|uniref:Uncharacterized protein n=1 Tax=Methylobacterium radiodurans TaxID=2202828 RepID=A0A2U8VU08_9HYPH|nr:hypothetical protein [Methylobacterium radiodurans]AWN37244.1 hypothetical protein DK427_17180 [Methylobacterium radiodurans]